MGGDEGTNSHSEAQKPFIWKWIGIYNWTWPLKVLWPFRMEKGKTVSVFWFPFPRSWKYIANEPLVVGHYPYKTCLWFQVWKLPMPRNLTHLQPELGLKVSFWPYILSATWERWEEAKYSRIKNNQQTRKRLQASHQQWVYSISFKSCVNMHKYFLRIFFRRGYFLDIISKLHYEW